MSNAASEVRSRIPVRRVRLPKVESPKYWYRGDPGVTSFAYALSAVFPDGERFFIDSVRAFRDRITDPTLAEEVRAFIGQESQHGVAHERYNEEASRQGFAVEEIIALCKSDLEDLRARLSPESQLAITCALEHFTAMLAEQLLGNPRVLEGVPSPHRELWRWHALEEAEHKAVAFDVYQEVCGSYLRRVSHYLLTSASFTLATGMSTLHLLREDGQGTNLRAYASLARFLFVDPGLARSLAARWFDYLRPDFHPNDRDDAELLEKWRLEGTPDFDTLSM